mgnify:CR=1 FL=1
MNALIVGSIGVYALLVGLNGNAAKGVSLALEDAPGFLPWAISAGVLAAAYEYGPTRPLVGPFLFLAILGFVLNNFDTLKSEFSKLSNASQNAN